MMETRRHAVLLFILLFADSVAEIHGAVPVPLADHSSLATRAAAAAVTTSGDALGEHGIEMRKARRSSQQAGGLLADTHDDGEIQARVTSHERAHSIAHIPSMRNKSQQTRVIADAHDGGQNQARVTSQERAQESDSHRTFRSANMRTVYVDAGGASVDTLEERSVGTSERLEKIVDAAVVSDASSGVAASRVVASRLASLPAALTNMNAIKSTGLASGLVWALVIGIPVFVIFIVGLYIFARYQDQQRWLASRVASTAST